MPTSILGGPSRGGDRAFELEVSDDLGFACRAQVHLQYAEAFRDGSLGWLACVYALDQAPDPAACAELRAFPTGEVLEVRGLAQAPGLARLDLVWPMLSPTPVEPSTILSWPLYADAREARRVVAQATWTRDGARWALAATLGDTDPGLDLTGTVRADLGVDREGVADAVWTASRRACALDDCVAWSSRGSLRRVEPSATLPGELVAARVAALAPRAGGTLTPAAYARLLRGDDTSPTPGCAGASPAE